MEEEGAVAGPEDVEIVWEPEKLEEKEGEVVVAICQWECLLMVWINNVNMQDFEKKYCIF